jgi:quercetin dioxygenase-like cupin family protein
MPGMAADEIADPTSGQRWVFLRTGGELLEAELHVAPGGFVREHVHPAQEEVFTGISGTFVLDVDRQPHAIGPGDRVVVPAGTPHGFREAEEDAVLKVEVRPALRLDDYFRSFLGLSRDGKLSMPLTGLPRPLLQAAVVLDAYAPEIAGPRLPLWLQRPAWFALAALGRLRGYRLQSAGK